MLRLSDCVTCRKGYYSQSGEGVYISALENCRKMKFRTYLHLTLFKQFFMFSRLNDFVVCSTSFYIWSSGAKVKNIM